MEQLALLPNSLHETFARFDRLNEDLRHFHNSNDICTPMGCVKEMVDTVPDELWRRRGLRVLDSCCGNGNFHAYIQTKVPLKHLYFNEINENRIRHVKEFFGLGINLTQYDFLTFEDDEKFDLVVSNPPYAKFCEGKRASKNHNLSRDFIRKAIELTKDGGYILFIAPDNWMSFSDRNTLPRLMSRYQFIHINIHGAKKWFPGVGSSFTWFLMQKVPNERAFTVENFYKKRGVEKARLDQGVDFIPLYFSEAVRKLFRKTVYSAAPKYKVETTSDLHRTTKRELLSEQQDSRYKYRLIHTPKQTVWSSRPHKFQTGWKVFLSLSDRYGAFVDNCGMTQSVAFIRCRSKSEALRVKQALEQPVYRALNNLTRYGNFNNIRVLQRLPELEYIKLTRQEQQLVEYFAGVI